MGDTVIKVEGVSKKFARRIRHNMLYGTIDVAKGMLGMEARTDSLRPGEFWAVDDVSLELKRGETLGLIGPNGSGKSTLLRLLNGIYQPDRGRIEIRGRVGALIAVGAGFHPLMTGRENIYLNGSILGMTRAEIDRKFDSIVDFADIGDFLDAPVKTYSSGMHVRLGFAIAIHCEPDILLVDEVLAVGDARFQQKCYSKIKSLRDAGKSIIIVTHNMAAILTHTSNAALIHNGKLITVGESKYVVDRYNSLMWCPHRTTQGLTAVEADETSGKPAEVLSLQNERGRTGMNETEDRCPGKPNYNPAENRFGNGKARIMDFEMLDVQGRSVTALYSGENLRFRFKVEFNGHIETPIYGLMVKTADGVLVYGKNTWYEAMRVSPRKAGDRVFVEFRQDVNLVSGDYFISPGVAEVVEEGADPVDRRDDMVHLAVMPVDKTIGLANLYSIIEVEEKKL